MFRNDALLKLNKKQLKDLLETNKENLNNINFSNLDLSAINLSGANLKGSIFNFTNLNGAILTEANLENAQFDHATLSSGCILNKANLTNTIFLSCDISNSYLADVITNKTTFDFSSLLGSEVSNCNLENSSLRHINPLLTQFTNSFVTRDQAAELKAQALLHATTFIKANKSAPLLLDFCFKLLQTKHVLKAVYRKKGYKYQFDTPEINKIMAGVKNWFLCRAKDNLSDVFQINELTDQSISLLRDINGIYGGYYVKSKTDKQLAKLIDKIELCRKLIISNDQPLSSEVSSDNSSDEYGDYACGYLRI